MSREGLFRPDPAVARLREAAFSGGPVRGVFLTELERLVTQQHGASLQRPAVPSPPDAIEPRICPQPVPASVYCISEIPTAWLRLTIAIGRARATGSFSVPP